jgi:antitoxin YefM
MGAEEKTFMSTTNATALRRTLFDTLEKVVEYNESVTVTTKKGNAVILSEEDYNAMVESIYLASQPGLVKKIKEGDKEDPKKMAPYDPKEAW